jgi:hypothetical protein
MPRSLRGLFLAGALVLAGCGVGGQEARDAVDPPEVTKAQLAAMVLPQTELGELAAGLKQDDDSGPIGNDEAADETIDPGDSGKSLRSAGRLAGHRLGFGGSNLAAQRKGQVVYAATLVELMEDTVYAAQHLHKQLGDAQRYAGQALGGVELTRVSTFEATDVGNEAEGLLATVASGGKKLQATVVVFRRGRVLGAAALLRADKDDAQNEARAIAIKLDKRIQDVLAGRIGAEQDDPEAPAEAPSFEGKEKLPDLTMAAADVAPGLDPVAEGETDGDGYVGYHRTFGEARLGGSHLISVRAETRLYESEAAAAGAAKGLAREAGRLSYAREAAKAFADETQVRPTNVQVQRLAGMKRGASGVVVTFDLVGAKFRIVSVFLRSGRMIETVSGVCRATAFDPDDLRPVAERARKRLTA